MCTGARRALLLLLVLALGGCDWLGGLFEDTSKVHLKGERISVLGLDKRIEPDPKLAETQVSLPPVIANPDWPQPGGNPSHAMQHVAFTGSLKRLWRADIGDGASRYGRVLSPPIVSDGMVFGMDARDTVVALDAKTGDEVWEKDPKPKSERDHAFGGGIAAANGRIFVTTGYGQVLALDAKTGKELWRQQVAAPMRGAPTVSGGRVFVITVEDQLDVLSAEDGHRLWTHSGIPETAGLLGAASPAVDGDIVVVPYSSGELFALRTENGRPLWTDNLATARPLGALSTLADIRGRPVIDHGRVFALSHSGRMVAIDLRTGDRVWEQEIGGTHEAWVAGDYIYVLANDVDLLCLQRADGRIRWVRDLPRYENEKKKKDPVRWSGPVLAGDKLIVIASDGDALAVSPYTGATIEKFSLPGGVFVDPVVAGGTLYVLTDEADLIALR